MSTEKNENVEIKVVDEKEALLNKKRSSKSRKFGNRCYSYNVYKWRKICRNQTLLQT